MKRIIYFIIASIAASSCTERIDIKLDETFTRLVVEGKITDDSTEHTVTLTRTTSYFYNQPAPRVEGAQVSLSDEENVFHLTETKAGVYKTEKMAGIIGRTYTLNIELAEEINGHSSYTATDKMMPVGVIDSIKLHYIDQWEVWEIRLFAQEPPTTDFYMFNWSKNGKLVTDTIDEVNVSDDKFFNGSYSNGIGVGWFQEEREDERLHPGDLVTLIMSTITEKYANFVWEIQDETGYNSPLFSGPPANVSSNISNGALGYFAAYPNRYASTIVGSEK
ncbi:MAG: DUF4249 domain-containing protein [Bacteroidales bacterium]|nr:DUF4249 domain-containing protein [Bacteroidales bacterium]MCF8386353.1 DUF4249 domain-containing protein [Bacteroidales bacterium]MCF8396805.1 DUF4249 domain-containing protein [Bacteroidales bacterium]